MHTLIMPMFLEKYSLDLPASRPAIEGNQKLRSCLFERVFEDFMKINDTSDANIFFDVAAIQITSMAYGG